MVRVWGSTSKLWLDEVEIDLAEMQEEHLSDSFVAQQLNQPQPANAALQPMQRLKIAGVYMSYANANLLGASCID